ncbi:acyl-CoA dehydrogenase [Nonomuraea terrae]|uniref:Acyl-CoA dehydrogenase n=1 Tax=Nonomuraea terrae TaxID=2530383 RepID=A0A4R4YZR6_9ACTN|nr:acyl-CoA dehydrogenase family protein [Nonomuraea terrae]TDD49999.1 acyl-CoA dehydrogenase [Nonomuraea terrae]
MTDELSTAERLLPGLDRQLRETGTAELESATSPGLRIFRQAGGPGLVVPGELGGLGASLVDALHIQRVLGARSPSLAVAVNMHVCTVLAMPPCAATEDLLRAVAGDHLYIASGFGEGRPGASVLAPTMRAERLEKGWRLNGAKKPCSLSESMDFLTASVALSSADTDGSEMALAIIPADAEGVSVRPFRSSPVLVGSETHEVVLTDVDVPDECMSLLGDPQSLNAALSTAFHTFELLVTASYVGAASGLVETVLERRRGTAAERVELVGELETVMASLEAVARACELGQDDPAGVARALYVRYSAQRTIERVAALATELLGGTPYMVSGVSATLFSAVRALAFHPPSRSAMADALDRFVLGEPLIIP